MFLPREKNILKLLWKSEKKLTTSQIAAELKVSPRTIKADIKKMNDVLKKHSCRICTKQGVGLWLDYDENGEHYLELLIYEDGDSYISIDTRKYYVAIELLLCKGYTSMESIANKLYVSKGTVVNDIAELEAFWKRFGITFIKKVKYGIKVEASELQRRLALIEALKQAVRREGRASKDKLQFFFEKTDLDEIRGVILQSEQRFHFVLSDPSFREFVIQLAVLMERLQQDCPMRSEEGQKEQNRKKQLSNSRERKEWFVIQYLKGQLMDNMGIAIPDEEDGYLYTCLQGLRFQVPMFQEKDARKLRERSPELFDYMMSVIREVDELYHLKLEGDSELYCAMFNHLECMIHRIQSKLYLENPILSSLKKEMFYEYEIASYFMSKFSAKYEIEPTEDEIGYITFYIGAALERMKESGQQILSAVLVCSTGVGTSQFLSVKLKRLFRELEIREIISSNQTDRLRPGGQDLVISTVPLKKEGLNVIQISSVLNETDIHRIQKHIQKGSFSCEPNKYLHLKQFLHEEISILNCDLRSREEVIKLLGGRMCTEGYVDEKYIASVFQREEVSETAIGSRLAIPHAFEGHILRQGIGLLTLQKPIEWGRERVQIVFMLALEASGETDFQKIFGDILMLTQNTKDLEQLLKAKKYREISIWK